MGTLVHDAVFGTPRARSRVAQGIYETLTPEEQRKWDEAEARRKWNAQVGQSAAVTELSAIPGMSAASAASGVALMRAMGAPYKGQEIARPVVTKAGGSEASPVPEVMDVGLVRVPQAPEGSPFETPEQALGITLPQSYRTPELPRDVLAREWDERLALDRPRPSWRRPPEGYAMSGTPLTSSEYQGALVRATGTLALGPAIAAMVELRDQLQTAPRKLAEEALTNIRENKPGAFATASMALPIAAGAYGAELASRPIVAGLRAIFDVALLPQNTLFGALALGREAMTGESVRGRHSISGAVFDPLLGVFTHAAHELLPTIVPAENKGRINAYEILWGIDPQTAKRPAGMLPSSREQVFKNTLAFAAEMVLDPAIWATLGTSGAMKIAGQAGTVALKKAAGRKVTAFMRGLAEGTARLEDFEPVLGPFSKELRPILVERAAREKALLAEGFDLGAVRERLAPLFRAKTEDAMVMGMKMHMDNVRFGRRVTSAEGNVFYRVRDPVTREVREISQVEHDISSTIVKRNIDLGGIGLMLPHRVEATKLWEFQRRTVVDAEKWYELALLWEPLRKADIVTRWAGSAVISPFSTYFNKFGRIPLAEYRLAAAKHGRMTYVQDSFRKKFENIIRANNLNGNQADLLITLLDTGKSGADGTLEKVRQQVLADPGLRAMWEQGVPLRKFVTEVMENTHIDEASAFTVAAAIRLDQKLDDPLLEGARVKAQPLYSQMVSDARLYGADISEIDNYVPRRPPRSTLKERMTKAVSEAKASDRNVAVEILADAWSGVKGTVKYPRALGGRQSAQFHRRMYRWRGVDGEVLTTDAKHLAVEPTNIKRVINSVAAVKSQKVAQLGRKLVPIDRRIDALLEITGGAHPGNIKAQLAEAESELRIINRDFVEPARKTEQELATLQKRRDALEHRVGVLNIVEDLTDPAGLQGEGLQRWVLAVGESIRPIEHDLLTLGMDDTITASLRRGLADRFYTRLDAIKEMAAGVSAGGVVPPALVQNVRNWVSDMHDTMGTIRQAIIDSDLTDRAANFDLGIAADQMRGLLDHRRALDKLDAIDTKIGMAENRLRVLNPSGARELRDETIAELAELRKARTAAAKLVPVETTRRSVHKQITQLQHDIANRVDAMMERIPNQADALFVKRQRQYQRAGGPPQVGDQVIVASGTHEPSTVIGHLYEDTPGQLRQFDFKNMPEGKFAPSVDETKLHYVVQNPDGTVRHYKRSSLQNPPDYGNLVFYNRETAYVDEINDAFPGMFDPGFTVPAAQRAVEHAKMLSDAEFYGNLKELGWARDKNPGRWVEVDARLAPQLKGYFVSEQTREFLLDMWKADQPVEGLLGFLQAMNNWWKATVTSFFPAFHGQNAFSNVWLNFMDTGIDALNPAELGLAITLNLWHRKAKKLERQAMGTGKTAVEAEERLKYLLERRVYTDYNGKEWLFGEFREAARTNHAAFTGRNLGVLDMDVPNSRELDRLAARQSAETPWQTFKVGVTGGVAAFGDYGRLTANFIEDVFRTQNFLTNLKKSGGDVVNAAERTNQFLFDYSQLTAFERHVIRPLIPFYSFAKKNLVLQSQMALARPAQLAFQAHLVNAAQAAIGEEPLSDEEMANLPAYMQRGSGFVTTRRDHGVGIMNNIGLPVQHALNTAMPWLKLATLQDLGFPRTGGLGLGSTTPFLKVPLEVGSSYYYWLDRSMGRKVRIDTLGSIIDRTPRSFRALMIRHYRIEKTEDDNGKTAYYAHNVKGAYVLQNLPPFSRAWTEIAKWQELKDPDTEIVPWLLEEFLGFNYRYLDEDTLRGYEDAALDAIARETGINESVSDAILETAGKAWRTAPITPRR